MLIILFVALLASLIPFSKVFLGVYIVKRGEGELFERELQLQLPPVEVFNIKLASNAYGQDFINNDYEVTPRENATILMLVRNTELDGALDSMRSLEDRFNNRYHYTWTFLNDVPFTDEFIAATSAMASGETEYGLIPAEDWDKPSWINETYFEECLEKMESDGVLYGGSKSYRNMCKFNSGYFFRQELLMKYDYYFRVEPNVEYFCDFAEDPFRTLRTKGKKYGFVMTLYEYHSTIPTLWNTVEGFMEKYPQHLHPNNSYGFITDKKGAGNIIAVPVYEDYDYNLCHFWSNFEVGDLNFFRSQAYLDFFNYLNEAGGFYYERWGDAPVHSIGLALLLDKNELHHFDELGYIHKPFFTCPLSDGLRRNRRCICDVTAEENLDITPHSCNARWWKHTGKYFVE